MKSVEVYKMHILSPYVNLFYQFFLKSVANEYREGIIDCVI